MRSGADDVSVDGCSFAVAYVEAVWGAYRGSYAGPHCFTDSGTVCFTNSGAYIDTNSEYCRSDCGSVSGSG